MFVSWVAISLVITESKGTNNLECHVFVSFSEKCEIADKEVQVTVQAQVDKEKEMSKKEVMATEALWSNI